MATLVDPATGLSAARAMANLGVLSWDGLMNAVLLGVVKRRPALSTACGVLWCSLALPFYAEPHFRSSKLGEFVTAVLDAVEDSRLGAVIETLRGAAAAESVPRSRLGLFERLVEAAKRRGIESERLSSELARWRNEAIPDRSAETPSQHDDVYSLSELEERWKAEPEKMVGRRRNHLRVWFRRAT
jgi:hypothetical protein